MKCEQFEFLRQDSDVSEEYLSIKFSTMSVVVNVEIHPETKGIVHDSSSAVSFFEHGAEYSGNPSTPFDRLL